MKVVQSGCAVKPFRKKLFVRWQKLGKSARGTRLEIKNKNRTHQEKIKTRNDSAEGADEREEPKLVNIIHLRRSIQDRKNSMTRHGGSPGTLWECYSPLSSAPFW